MLYQDKLELYSQLPRARERKDRQAVSWEGEKMGLTNNSLITVSAPSSRVFRR